MYFFTMSLEIATIRHVSSVSKHRNGNYSNKFKTEHGRSIIIEVRHIAHELVNAQKFKIVRVVSPLFDAPVRPWSCDRSKEN